MRVAIVSESFPPGAETGAALGAFTLAERLSHHDDVEVITLDRRAPLDDARFHVHYLDLPHWQPISAADTDDAPGAGATGGPQSPFTSFRQRLWFGWQIATLARQRRYDVIHTQDVDSTLSAYLTRHWHRRPLVTTLRSYEYASNRWSDLVAQSSGAAMPDRRTPWQRRMSELQWLLPRRALGSCRRVFTVSDFVRHVHVNAGVVDARRATTIHNFLPEIPSGLPSRRSLRMRFGYEGPTILYAGDLTARNGIHMLVKAMERVVREIPTARLVVAGAGDQRQLRLIAERKGVERNLIFEGIVQSRQLLEMVAAVDLVVVPAQFNEPSNDTLLDALALDCPVVATRVGGASEMVSDRENGYLVEPNDERLLGASIVRALKDRDLPKRAATANAHLRDGRLSPTRTLERVREAYRAAA